MPMPKQKANSKREKVNVLEMIRAVLTDVLLAGLEWKGLRCHRRASPRPEKTTPNIQIENLKKNKEEDEQHRENKKNKYKKEETLEKKKYDENNLRYREENREAMRQTQIER